MKEKDQAYQDYLAMKKNKGKRPGEEILKENLKELTQEEKNFYEHQFVQFAKMRHTGSRVFIMGTGPSVLDIPKTVLDQNITIGCNGIGNLYHPSYYVICDPFVYGIHKEVFSQSSSFKILSAFTKGECDSFVYYKEQNIIGLSSDELYSGSNTGFFMLSIAYLMGATEIYLLGFDGYNSSNNKFHCYNDEGVERERVEYEWNNSNPEILVFQDAMRFAVKKMQEDKKRLILVGDSTYLGDIVPKISISDFIKKMQTGNDN